MLGSGAPAVLHLPQRAAAADAALRLPVAILAHDYAANAGAMGSLARRLARAGYAALALDLQGHGAHPLRLASDLATSAPVADLQAALEWVMARPDLDPQRIALIGHGAGGSAALAQAQWNPAQVAAVVALSARDAVAGPYPAPNALLLWGAWEPTAIRRAGRRLGAQLAGHDQVIADRTYGDPRAGGAVRIGELDWVFPRLIPYSRAAADHVIAWLDQTLSPRWLPPGLGTTRAPRDPPLGWSGLGLAAALILAWGLPRARSALATAAAAPAAATGSASELARLGQWLACAAPAALLTGAVSAAGARTPLGLLPLGAARDALVFLSLWGLLLLAPGVRAGAVPEGLRARGTWAAAGALALIVYALLGALLSPWIDAYPAASRLGPIALAAAAALPHFAALECGLRSGTAPFWLPIAGRALALALLAAVWWLGLVPGDAIACMPVLLLTAPLFELIGARLAAAGANPWVAALVQSLCLGWLLGSLSPLLASA